VILVTEPRALLPQNCGPCYISSLLGIPTVVACHQQDGLVDYSEERFRILEEEFLRAGGAARTGMCKCIPVSASPATT